MAFRVPVQEQRVGLAGPSQSGASADAFGSDIGAGLQRGAAGFDRAAGIAIQQQRELDEQKIRTQAATLHAEAQVAQRQAYTDAIQSAPADGAGLRQTVEGAVKSVNDTYLARATQAGPRVRAALEPYLISGGGQLALDAQKTAFQMQTADSVRQLSNTVDVFTNTVRVAPELHDEKLDALPKLIDGSALPSSEKAKALEIAKDGLLKAKAYGVIDQDPEQFLDEAKRGGYSTMKPADLEGAMSHAQVEISKRVALRAKVDAEARVAAGMVVDDNLAMALDGKTPPSLTPDQIRVLTPTDRVTYQTKLDINSKVGAVMIGLPAMSDGEIFGALAQLKPQDDGTPGYALKDAAYRQAMEKVKPILAERLKDPAQAAYDSSPVIRNAWDNGQMGAALEATGSTLRTWGHAEAPLVPGAQLKKMVSTLESAHNADDAVAILHQWETDAGQYYPRMFEQLSATKKFDKNGAILVGYLPASEQAVQWAASQAFDERFKAMGESDKKAFSEAYGALTARGSGDADDLFQSVALASGDSTRSGRTAQMFADGIKARALHIMSQSSSDVTADKAMKLAYQEITNSFYVPSQKWEQGAIFPKNINGTDINSDKVMGLVQKDFNKILTGQDFLPMPPNFAGQTEPPLGDVAPKRDSVGLRGNNPGNIKASSTTLAYTGAEAGSAASDGGQFVKFKTPVDGLAAMGRHLQGYVDQGFDTPAKIIGRWAPSSSNDTSAYLAAVTQRTGLAPDQPVNFKDPTQLRNFMRAMITQELGGQPYSTAEFGDALGRLGLQQRGIPLDRTRQVQLSQDFLDRNRSQLAVKTSSSDGSQLELVVYDERGRPSPVTGWDGRPKTWSLVDLQRSAPRSPDPRIASEIPPPMLAP